MAAPVFAGIVNTSGNFYANSNVEHREIYNHIGQPFYYRDITQGICGVYTSDWAAAGGMPAQVSAARSIALEGRVDLSKDY